MDALNVSLEKLVVGKTNNVIMKYFRVARFINGLKYR